MDLPLFELDQVLHNSSGKFYDKFLHHIQLSPLDGDSTSSSAIRRTGQCRHATIASVSLQQIKIDTNSDSLSSNKIGKGNSVLVNGREDYCT